MKKFQLFVNGEATAADSSRHAAERRERRQRASCRREHVERHQYNREHEQPYACPEGERGIEALGSRRSHVREAKGAGALCPHRNSSQ